MMSEQRPHKIPFPGAGITVPPGLNVPPHTIRPRAQRTLSEHRCNVQTDTGGTQGSLESATTICLAFARGCCPQGKLCRSLHRVPVEADEQVLIMHPGIDIFGRQQDAVRRSTWTLAASSDQRTLYVNYQGAGSLTLPHIRHLLQTNFSAWGPVEAINIRHHLTIAFVTYSWRCSAEFAKEAMDGQKLLGSTQSEVLMVRWSRAGAAWDTSRPINPPPEAHEEDLHDAWEHMSEEQRAEHVRALNRASAIKLRRVGDYPCTDKQYQRGEAGPDFQQPPMARAEDGSLQDETTASLQHSDDEPQQGTAGSNGQPRVSSLADDGQNHDGKHAMALGYVAHTGGPPTSCDASTGYGAPTGYGNLTGYGTPTGYGAPTGDGPHTGYGTHTKQGVSDDTAAASTGHAAADADQGSEQTWAMPPDGSCVWWEGQFWQAHGGTWHPAGWAHGENTHLVCSWDTQGQPQLQGEVVGNRAADDRAMGDGIEQAAADHLEAPESDQATISDVHASTAQGGQADVMIKDKDGTEIDNGLTLLAAYGSDSE